jgi:Fe2+ or Zn2+ uptake regulation protein
MEEITKTLLRENGYKATPARLAILKIFFQSQKPQDASSICKKITKTSKQGKVNEVTIYRTLSALEKSGILRKVNLRKNSEYFELNKDHHHHIVCTKCSMVESFKDKNIEEVLKKVISKSSKFKNIKEHSLELFGLCVKCS